MVKGKKPQAAKKLTKQAEDKKKPAAATKQGNPATTKDKVKTRETGKPADFASLLEGLNAVRGMPQIVKARDAIPPSRGAQSPDALSLASPASREGTIHNTEPAPAQRASSAPDILSLMESAPWAKKRGPWHAKPLPAAKEPVHPPSMWPDLGALKAPDGEMPQGALEQAPEHAEISQAETAPQASSLPQLRAAPAAPASDSARPSWQSLLENFWSKPSDAPPSQAGKEQDEPVLERHRAPLNDFIWSKVAAGVGMALAPAQPEDDQESDQESNQESDQAVDQANDEMITSNLSAAPVLGHPQTEPLPSAEEENNDTGPFADNEISTPKAEAPSAPQHTFVVARRDEPPATLAALLAVAKQAERDLAPPSAAVKVAPESLPAKSAKNGHAPRVAQPAVKAVRPSLKPSSKDIPVEDLLGGVFSLIVSGFRGASPALKKIQENGATGVSSVGKGVRQIADKLLLSQKGKDIA
jgi:hypothetical protein